MSWQKISLTNDQVVNTEHMRIQNEFEKLFIGALAPKEAALFSTKVPISKQEFLVLFFSPGCSPMADSIISQHAGTPCEKPKKNEVALLVGHDNAWILLD